MATPIVSIAIYSLLPALGMMVGGAIASIYQPNNKLTSATQHFAAGVVFAAVAKELLPKLGADNRPLALLIGFLLGVVSMLLLKEMSNKLTESEKTTGVSLGLVTAVGIDLLIDGILIGVAFLTGTKGGLLIAIALTLEIFFLGLSTTATLGARSVSIKTKFLLTLVLALLVPIGSVFGAALLSQLPNTITDGILAFGIAALLYLVTEELLTEAHGREIKETPFITASFFVGFLCILLLENFSS